MVHVSIIIHRLLPKIPPKTTPKTYPPPPKKSKNKNINQQQTDKQTKKKYTAFPPTIIKKRNKVLGKGILIRGNMSAFQFQRTSEAKPKPNNHLDEKWGPQLFHLIQKSRETQLKNMADDALRELNALQRSARAHEEATKSSVSFVFTSSGVCF